MLEGKDHLFISASGSLSTMPFSILVSEVPEGPSGDPKVLRNAKWLGDQMAQVQLPSIQSFKFVRAQNKSDTQAYGQNFIGFGDPVLEGRALTRSGRLSGQNRVRPNLRSALGFQGNAMGASADVDLLRSMASLPGTARELTAMWDVFGQPEHALFLQDDASETAVRNTLLNANVIVFATHGVLADDIYGGSEPGLVFTPPAVSLPLDDGYLSSSDIAALDIRAEWVVLSACNTAAGDGSSGSAGLSGIARSFFYAGASRLLASHWPVRDDVAAVLTVRVIEIGKKSPGFSKAMALQQAMIELRNNTSGDSDTDTWAHPNAWAPFVLVGDR